MRQAAGIENDPWAPQTWLWIAVGWKVRLGRPSHWISMDFSS